MRTLFRSIGFAALLGLAPAFAQGIEFRSVSEPSILFDTPSDKGNRLFIIAPGTPVEVVVTLDKWVKVRDAGGTITWIERRALSDKRTVMVTAPRAVARRQASADAPAAFEAVKDVVLELAAPPQNGWVEVRHPDGATGYLRVSEVWGV